MMTAIQPDIAPRGRYGASAAAALLGIHRNTLYKYARAGLISKHEGRYGRSYYLGADLIKLWRVF